MKKISIAIFIAILAGIILTRASASGGTVPPEKRIDGEPFIVECTAYCDEGITASGRPTVEGLTMAGPREWMGCAAVLWKVNEDGTIGEYIGIRQFTDTGYGRDGDIQRGETVDIYIPNYDECIEWGRRRIYIQIIEGKG